MKTRKFLAVVLAVTMLVSLFSVPAFAEGEAMIVEDLGILIGDGDGVTAEYLAKTATKLQGAMVTLRLLGLDEEAEAFMGTDTFLDAGDATAYWAPILAYLKANPEVGFVGNEDGTFAVGDILTAQMFNKVLLTVLGYAQDVDFTWAETNEFAESMGLMALAGKTELTNEDIAMAIVEALGLEAADGMTLITHLVMNGVIDEADAMDAGFTVEYPELEVVDAYASGLKVITLVTNMEIPEEATISLKKGTVGLNVETIEVAEDMMSATLTGYFNYIPGTYTVMVDDASFTFAIAAEMAVDLQIGADSVYKMSGQDLMVKLSNQYDEAMSLVGATISVINVTDGGSAVPFTPSTTVTIDASTADADDELFVFIYDATSMKSVQGNVMVKAAPVLTSLTFGDVTIKDDKAAIYENTEGHILEVMAVDQYGDPYTLTSLPAGITWISSNETTMAIGDFTLNSDGNIVFEADEPGTATLTAIIPTTGFYTTSMPVEVWADPVLTTVEIMGATTPLYVNETGTLEAHGFDQYGAEIDLDSNVTFSSTHTGIMPTMAGADVEITPTMAGTATIFYYLNGVLVSSFTVEVNPEAYPQVITAMDVTDAIQTGVMVTVDSSAKATVHDQYGRVMTDAKITDAGYDVAITSSAMTHVALMSAAGLEYTFYAVGSAGAETFKAYLTTNGGMTVIEATVFAFDVENITASDIVTVEMGEVPTMYSGDAKTDLISPPAADIYNETLTFVGKTAEGGTVALLDDNGDGVPDIIDVITTSTETLMISGATLTASGAAGTAMVKAWRDGNVLDWIEITLSETDPVATTMMFVDTTITTTELAEYTGLEDLIFGDNLVIKDQYGRELYFEYVFGAYLGMTSTYNGTSYTEVNEHENAYVVITDFFGGDDMYAMVTITMKDGTLSASFKVETWLIGP